MSRLAAEWGRALVQALALVEASIDFADEELPADVLRAGADRAGGGSCCNAA